MNTIVRILCLCTLTLSLSLSADPVDEGLITQFQAGDAASAADVNLNFQALIDAINDNAAQMQGLRDDIAKLPGTFLLPKPSLEANITGSSYKVFVNQTGIGTASRSNPTGTLPIVKHTFEELIHILFSEEATLNADGTFSYVFSGSEQEIWASTFAEHDVDSVDFPRVARLEYNLAYEDQEADTIIGDWSLSGQELSLTFPADGEDGPETIIMNLSPDGNVLMLGSRQQETWEGVNIQVNLAQMIMAVRSYEPEPNLNVQIDNTGNFPARIDAVNNGTPFHLFNAVNNIQDTKRIYIENSGDADLVVGSIALIQESGAGFSIQEIIGTLTIAPNAEESIEIDSLVAQMNAPIYSAVYVFTNDPDTPTFIVQIKSESISAPDNS